MGLPTLASVRFQPAGLIPVLQARPATLMHVALDHSRPQLIKALPAQKSAWTRAPDKRAPYAYVLPVESEATQIFALRSNQCYIARKRLSGISSCRAFPGRAPDCRMLTWSYAFPGIGVLPAGPAFAVVEAEAVMARKTSLWSELQRERERRKRASQAQERAERQMISQLIGEQEQAEKRAARADVAEKKCQEQLAHEAGAAAAKAMKAQLD